MNSLFATQKQIITKLQAQLQQRDAALFAILDKYGPQTFITDTLAVPVGSAVACHVNVDEESITFTAIKPKEIHYEEVQSEKAGDQKADCGEVKAGE
jgi:hypothetical protein